MSLIKLNQPVNLNLQLEERETNKFVRAFLKDANGTDLATIDLVHNSNGLYQDDSFLMPNTPELTASFIVYDDALYTQETCEYGSALSVFTLFEDSSSNPTLPQNCPEEIIEGVIQDSGLLEGKIIDNGQLLFGFINSKDQVLQGLLQDNDSIIGHLYSDYRMLEGTIIEEEENLAGEIFC